MSRTAGAAPLDAQAAQVTIDRTTQIGTSQLALGVTHTQYSLDSWGDKTAVANATSLLTGALAYQNQHIYGWGATNPEPTPGVYDWSSLDRRVAMMRSMGATMVITLCCAPDWMTSIGKATSTYPNIPPTANHIIDFANLARQIALRYPDVRYYQVWNEMKGFWDPKTNNWDYVSYTKMYNAVYDALKSVNPAIQVGGPYLVIEGTGSNTGDWSTATPITQRNWAVLNYWLANKHGADFITVDRAVQDYHDSNTYSQDQLLHLTQTFEDVARQIRAKSSLPLWWAEDYFVGDSDWNYQSAGLASILYHEIRGGTAVSLRWQPQGSAGDLYNGNQESLFSDTRVAGGGQPFPAYSVYKAIHDNFGPGTALYKTSSSDPTIEVLASSTRTLLINTRPTAVTVDVNGAPVTINGYGIALV